MKNDTYISFYLSQYRFRVFRKAIEDIGNPPYIRFLVKEDGNSMIMESYDKRDLKSHRVPQKRGENWRVEINSMPLCKLLTNRLGWESDKSYRIPGKTYPAQRIAVFDLSAAQVIQKQ